MSPPSVRGPHVLVLGGRGWLYAKDQYLQPTEETVVWRTSPPPLMLGVVTTPPGAVQTVHLYTSNIHHLLKLYI